MDVRVAPMSAASLRSVGSRDPGPRPARADSARISSASRYLSSAGIGVLVPAAFCIPVVLPALMPVTVGRRSLATSRPAGQAPGPTSSTNATNRDQNVITEGR